MQEGAGPTRTGGARTCFPSQEGPDAVVHVKALTAADAQEGLQRLLTAHVPEEIVEQLVVVEGGVERMVVVQRATRRLDPVTVLRDVDVSLQTIGVTLLHCVLTNERQRRSEWRGMPHSSLHKALPGYVQACCGAAAKRCARES